MATKTSQHRSSFICAEIWSGSAVAAQRGAPAARDLRAATFGATTLPGASGAAGKPAVMRDGVPIPALLRTRVAPILLSAALPRCSSSRILKVQLRPESSSLCWAWVSLTDHGRLRRRRCCPGRHLLAAVEEVAGVFGTNPIFIFVSKKKAEPRPCVRGAGRWRRTSPDGGHPRSRPLAPPQLLLLLRSGRRDQRRHEDG